MFYTWSSSNFVFERKPWYLQIEMGFRSNDSTVDVFVYQEFTAWSRERDAIT